MELRRSLRCLCAVIILNVFSSQMVEELIETKDINKDILEMLHIKKLLKLQQTKPHPYMKQVYQLLNTQELRHRDNVDGTLVQSFRSVQGTNYNPPGWIWFNISHLNPSITSAELVLLRKTVHPQPLTVTVAVHCLSPAAEHMNISNPLTEHLLTLNQLPPSGYDVFNVTSALLAHRHGSKVLGFQLHFRDEAGSLVLHEALTHSLYWVNTSSLSQPLLVTYNINPKEKQRFKRRQRQCCRNTPHQKKCQMQHRQQRSKGDVTCQLHYIDIQNSELGQWIVQPTAFNISFCRGILCHQRLAQKSADPNEKAHEK